MNKHSGASFAQVMYDEFGLEVLPPPPDNLDFLELFTEDEQAEIARRFHAGIELGRARLAAARQRQARSDRLEFERRTVRRERRDRRFNPVLR